MLDYVVLVYLGCGRRICEVMTLMPNKSLELTRVGVSSSAIAVHAFRSRVAQLCRWGKMRRISLSLLFAILLTACDRTPSSPSGVKEWTEVQSLAEAFVLRGDSEALRSHTDFSGVPSKDILRMKEVLREWKGASPELKLATTEVMTPAEFEAREEKEWLAKSGGRPSTLPPTKWNIQPEKLIVFTFVSKDPSDKTTNIRWFVGAFRKNGLWYFATSDLT